MEYIEKKITENVSGEDLAKRVRSPAQRQFRVRSMQKEKKEQADNTKGEGLRQSADLQARVSSENDKSSAVRDLTKFLFSVSCKDFHS